MLTVADAQITFAIGGGHSENPGDPAPEDGAGAAESDGGGDADDISRAEVAASVVERAEKGERFRVAFNVVISSPAEADPFPAEAASSAENRESRMARKRFLWGKRSLKVK